MLNSYSYAFLVINIVFVYILKKYMEVFYGEKSCNNGVHILSLVLFYIVRSYIHIVINDAMVSFFSNIILYIALSYNYKVGLMQRIKGIVSIYAFLLLSEIFTVFFIRLLFSNYEIINEQLRLIIEVTTIQIFIFLFLQVISKFKMTREGNNISFIYWLAIFLIPLGTTYFGIYIISMADYQKPIYILLNIIFLFIINIVVFYLYDSLVISYKKQTDSKVMEIQNQSINEHFRLVKEVNESTSVIRHDLKAHLFTISDLIGKNAKDEANDYIDNIINKISFSKKYADSSSPEINSILNYKINQADKKDIKVNCHLDILEKVNIDLFDLTVILNNIMDNAIDANIKIKEQDMRTIDIDIRLKDNLLLIYCKNPYVGKIKYINNRYFSTKDQRAHSGIGLKSVENAVNKYQGVIKKNHTKNTFKIEIMLYNS